MAETSETKNLKVLLIEDDSYVVQLYQDIIASEANWELEIIDSLTNVEKDFERIKKLIPM